jgi:hypothetical protein
MGQLMNPNGAIFLSAGVPDPTKAHFVADADSAAIAAAVSALLHVTLGRRRLVWGGHPSITPMIWSYAESMEIDYAAWVTLYQSALFSPDFPVENERFGNVVITSGVDDDIVKSLTLMRVRMITETEFSAAVFIGGMQGIFDEHRLFREHAPQARILPIVSAGGAAGALGQELGVDSAFAEELDYIALLMEQLEIDPNEKRYPTPTDQPLTLRERIEQPKARSTDEGQGN